MFTVRFLQKCLDNSVSPKGIQRRIRKAKVHHSAVIERAFTKDELGRSRLRLRHAISRFHEVYQKARSFLSPCDFIRLSWLLSELDCRQRLFLERKYDDSVKRLRLERFGSPTDNYDTIINLADVELTTLQKELLCRGVDFGIPPTIREPEILAEFELLQRQTDHFVAVSKSATERSKSELAAIARQFIIIILSSTFFLRTRQQFISTRRFH